MSRIAAEAVAAAVRKLAELRLNSRQASALEAYLTARRLEEKAHWPPTVAQANEAVQELFVVLPDDPRGRIRPFLGKRDDRGIPQWGDVEDSGRKTVWNVSTRGHTIAGLLFKGAHIQGGFKDDALRKLSDLLGDERPDRLALAILLLRDREFPDGVDAVGLEGELCNFLGIDREELELITKPQQLEVQPTAGESWRPQSLPADLRPPAEEEAARDAARAQPTADWHRALADEDTIVLDERTAALVKTAIVTARAVVLVGPPGTGKSTLLRQMAAEIAADHEAYGFGAPIAEPLWATPDESWSTRELLGGETVVGGDLRFAPGYVAQSIADDRWLVLDELNRADMDRIFGGLFTWLAGQPVAIGRLFSDPIAPNVYLGWNDDSSSRVVGDVAAGHGDAAPVRFLAGQDWRLLGTYNAADVHRVFRLGHALGRRFVRIPIPPADPEAFTSALGPRAAGLNARTKEKIVALYRAHLDIYPLGPAFFLDMPTFIAADTSEPAQRLANAYVARVGPWLAIMEEDQLARLRDRIVGTGKPFETDEWQWVMKATNLLA